MPKKEPSPASKSPATEEQAEEVVSKATKEGLKEVVSKFNEAAYALQVCIWPDLGVVCVGDLVHWLGSSMIHCRQVTLPQRRLP